MSKLAQNFAKYMVQAKMESNGTVEKPDVIGAVFGQTEGLLGSDLDLRELQKTGRVGRIEVNVSTERGKSTATISIPSSLDASETSLIAASIETIDKVGPSDAVIKINNIEDVRSQKRKYVLERAKTLLTKLIEDMGVEDSQKLSESIKEGVRSSEIINYKGLSAGPDTTTSDDIIIVEGRADVINLLKNGIRNSIAIEGSKIPDAIIGLTKEKTTTAFLDGDRGGDLDLKKLLSVAEVDYIAHAERGKEVEELTKKQIFKSLRDKIPSDQKNIIKTPSVETKVEINIDENKKKMFKKKLDEMTGTRAAHILDNSMNLVTKVPISKIDTALKENSGETLILDGKINQMLIDVASRSGVSIIVGTAYAEKVSKNGVEIFIEKDFNGK